MTHSIVSEMCMLIAELNENVFRWRLNVVVDERMSFSSVGSRFHVRDTATENAPSPNRRSEREESWLPLLEIISSLCYEAVLGGSPLSPSSLPHGSPSTILVLSYMCSIALNQIPALRPTDVYIVVNFFHTMFVIGVASLASITSNFHALHSQTHSPMLHVRITVNNLRHPLRS